MFISGVPAVKQASDAFSMFDGGQKAEHGLEFGDQTFGSARNSIKFLGRDQNQSGKNIRKSRLMTGVVIFFSGNEVAQWHIFSIQHRLVAPVVPNSCLVLPGLRNLHLSSVRREIVQFNLSDIVEGN